MTAKQRLARRTQDDRGMAALIIVIVVCVLLSSIAVLILTQIVGETPITTAASDTAMAQQAAQAGIAEYESLIAGNPAYATKYCSNAAFTVRVAR